MNKQRNLNSMEISQWNRTMFYKNKIEHQIDGNEILCFMQLK